MNCKPGDLAVMVNSCCGNKGTIVTCIRISHHLGCIAPGGLFEDGPIWEVDRDIKGWGGDVSRHVPDSQLRPIRDNPGEDETLRWTDKPSEALRKEAQALTDKLNNALERLRQLEQREKASA